MEMEPGKFLRTCGLIALGIFAVTALFNYAMDPYLIFGIPRTAGLNARKPAVESQQFLIKAYDVLRAYPTTVILGSSSVGQGIDPESSAWPPELRPVYNLGIANTTPIESYRYLQHVTARAHVRVVVLGLEFRDLLAPSDTEKQDYESRLVVKRDGSRNTSLVHQYLHDVVHSTMSLDASVDSFYTLSGNLSGDSSDIIQGGWDYRPYRFATSGLGSFPLMVLNDFSYSYTYPQAKVDLTSLTDVRNILNLCQRRGIRVILILDPTHADELEILDRAGKWPAIEEWKRKLTTLAAQYSRSGEPVELWDFNGYDDYSTEPVYRRRTALHWFLNPAHYTHPLGDIMLRQIFSGTDTAFGARLTPKTVEARLRQVRDQQLHYRELQQSDIDRVSKIYELAARTHSTSG